MLSIPLGSPGRPPPRSPSNAVAREFIAGEENRILKVAADAVLEGGGRFSPLLLTGPTGSGKTHLAVGLGQVWRHADSETLILSGADFARRCADAIETDDLTDFRTQLGAVRLMVLDNLDELANKPYAQRELVLALELWSSRRANVLVTSRRPIGSFTQLDPALVSRLRSGLQVTIRPPTAETRMAMARRVADVFGISTTTPVIERITAESSTTRWFPQFQQMLLQLDRFAQEQDAPLDESVAERFLREGWGERRPTIKSIAAAVARYFREPLGELRGPGRRQAVVRARSVAMFLARKLTDSSLQKIGKHFGNRDHTTVLYACRKIEHLRPHDPAVRDALEEIERVLS